ncbi:cytoplasmic protein, partial [Streptomyces pharetrae]
LVRKDREVYAALFPGVPDDLPYVWPASDREPRQASAGR